MLSEFCIAQNIVRRGLPFLAMFGTIFHFLTHIYAEINALYLYDFPVQKELKSLRMMLVLKESEKRTLKHWTNRVFDFKKR